MLLFITALVSFSCSEEEYAACFGSNPKFSSLTITTWPAVEANSVAIRCAMVVFPEQGNPQITTRGIAKENRCLVVLKQLQSLRAILFIFCTNSYIHTKKNVSFTSLKVEM